MQRRFLLAVVVGLLVLAPVGRAGAQERERLDIRVLTHVPSPGQPEGIVVDTDGTIYVGTHNYGNGDADAPSEVFAFDPQGELLREYEIELQADDEDHGILQMAFDADGLLYILGRNPAHVFTLDPETGEQEIHATFADVPPCHSAGDGEPCSDTVTDLNTFPDYPVFAPDGTMYVTDLEQALIWRVPPGGGEAEVWFTDARLESVFGPNGIQFMADGETLLFAQTGSHPPGTDDASTGKLYTLPVEADGSAGELEVFWEGRPVDGPDGFAIAESGNVYVALAGANLLLVLDPEGAELDRVPATPIENEQQEVPFDTPASVAFHGERALITNQSFFAGEEDHWVVFDVFVGEEGLPLYRPDLTPQTTEQTATQNREVGTEESEGRTSLPTTGGGAAALALAAIGTAWALDRRKHR